MPDYADPLPLQPLPDPDMPPRKAPAGGKLKKPLTDKQRAAAEQRLARLRSHLLLRPLGSPSARPLPPAHEAALRALGLLDFARLDLHSDGPRPDLVAPLVAYYDPACKRSFVRGVRVAVSRHDLARALSLPPKPAPAAAAPLDVDPSAVPPAVMQLLQDYVLLPFQGDDMCILPQEVAAAEQSVREGAAHRVDWAGLIWGLVEKEMLELPKRDDGVCYFGMHLQRLIWAQKPNLFELVEDVVRAEVVPEASVDLEMDDEDVSADVDVKSKTLEEMELENLDTDADVKSKTLEELELGNADTDAEVKIKTLEELELGNADMDSGVYVGSNSLEESELGNTEATGEDPDKLQLRDAIMRSTNLEELGQSDMDARKNDSEELDAVDGYARSKSFNESEAVDDDERSKDLNELEVMNQDVSSKDLNELEVVNKDGKETILHEFETVDEHVKGTNLEEPVLGFVTVEAVPAAHGVMPVDNVGASQMAPEGQYDVAVTAEEDDEEPLVETVIVTQEEAVSVAEEVGDEEAEGEEENDATGLSLGINSIADYDSMDAEEDTHVENLDEGDSENEEAEESEDDAFVCNGREEMNWRIGDGKEDDGVPHCLQRCNTFGMEFENLNKGEAEMRDELRFDDFSGKASLERMTSSNLLQAMNSIPSSFNVTENVHGLSSGEFLAMGADAHKSRLDLGAGSSYLFENNGKRHIDDIDGYNGNMQVQEQFPQCNQQKRMRHSNSSSVSTGSAFFNANFLVPMQNVMAEASRIYEQKEQALQSLQFEKQHWSNMLQQKEAIIQSLNSSQFEQHNKYQAELRRFEHDLNVMAQLVTAYKKALKQTRSSFDEYRKKFPCNKPLYGDVAGGGGLVLSVRELEKRRFEEQQQQLAAATAMFDKFEYEWFSKLEEWSLSVNSLYSRMEGLCNEIQLLKDNRRAKFETPATEECVPCQSEAQT